MARRASRRQQPPRWLLAGLVVLLALLVGASLLVTEADRAPSDAAASRPVAVPTGSEEPAAPPADTTLQELLGRAEPDADGNFDLRIAEDELAGAIRSGVTQSDVPVNDLRVDVLDREGPGGRVGFDARLQEPALPVSGEIDLNIIDGRLEPEIASARVGGLPLPGIAEGLFDDVLHEARRLSDALAARGIVLSRLETADGVVSISGRAPE